MKDPEEEKSIRQLGREVGAEVSTLTVHIDKLEVAVRRKIRLLAASVAFDVVLSLGLGYVAHRALTASDRANRATATAVAAVAANSELIRANCVSANETRALNLAMWHGVIGLLPPATSDAGQQRLDAILGLADRTFAPKDC